MKQFLWNIRLLIESLLWMILIYILSSIKYFGIYIRISVLQADRIGPLASEPDKLIHSKDFRNPKIKDIGIARVVCNKPLLENLRQYFPIIESAAIFNSFTRFRDRFHSKLRPTFFIESSMYTFGKAEAEKSENYKVKLLPSISDSVDRFLQENNIPLDAWFVCFHNRDGSYLDHTRPERDWSHHDYRDCDIDNFIEAMEYVVSKGGYAFRMGEYNSKPLPHHLHKNIIDYSTHLRTPELDIGLIARSKFFVGNTSGLYSVATLFGVPVAMTNTIPYCMWAYSSQDLVILKHIYSEAEKRHLTYDELCSLGMFTDETGQSLTSFYEERNLRVVENSPSEILMICKAMNEQVDTGIVEKSDLQRNFAEKYMSDKKYYRYIGRVEENFLKENWAVPQISKNFK